MTSTSMLSGLARILSDRVWINPLFAAFANDRGNGKLAQLAAACGLETPRTLATNDAEEARTFVSSCPEGAIFKPFLTPTRKVDDDGERQRYGAVYTTRALDKLDGVRHAPCMFQELIPSAATCA